MPSITFIGPGGGPRTIVEAAIGGSVMRAAVTHGVEGILGECGGAAACATCHVFISPRPGLPVRSLVEDEMLENTAVPRQVDSRLACQVFVTADMEGLQVALPDSQL